MIDIKKLRENPELLQQKWKSRGLDVDVDKILAQDNAWRQAVTQVEELKSVRNSESKKIGMLKKNGEDASGQMAAVKKIGDDIKELDDKANSLAAEMN